METLVLTHTTNNTEKQMMTSLEIAEVTGKQHNDVMKAIRKMEPAWEKTTGLNFQLSEYKDPTARCVHATCLPR